MLRTVRSVFFLKPGPGYCTVARGAWRPRRHPAGGTSAGWLRRRTRNFSSSATRRVTRSRRGAPPGDRPLVDWIYCTCTLTCGRDELACIVLPYSIQHTGHASADGHTSLYGWILRREELLRGACVRGEAGGVTPSLLSSSSKSAACRVESLHEGLRRDEPDLRGRSPRSTRLLLSRNVASESDALTREEEGASSATSLPTVP